MSLQRAVRGTGTIVVITLISSLASYTMRILLARNLTVSEYGLFYAILAFFAFIGFFIDLGLYQSVSKHIIGENVRKSFSISKGILKYTFIIQISISATIFTYLIFSADSIVNAIFHTDNKLIFLLMAVWFLTLPISMFLVNFFVGFKRPEYSALTDLFRQVGSLIITAILLVIGFGIFSPFLAYAPLNILMFIIYYPLIKRVYPKFWKIESIIQMHTLKNVLKYGLLIAVSTLVTSIITQTDTLMISYYLGQMQVGIYHAALPLSNITTYFTTAIVLVSFPFIAELHARNLSERIRLWTKLIYKYSLLLSIPAIVLIYVFSDMFIVALFGVSYLEASHPLKILLLGSVFSLMTLINNNLLIAIGKAKVAAKSMLMAALMNISINFILIPLMGISGAAIASMVSYLVAFCVTSFSLIRKTSIALPVRESIILILSGIIMAGFMLLFSSSGIYLSALASLLSFTIFLLILWILKIISIDEIRFFISQIIPRKRIFNHD